MMGQMATMLLLLQKNGHLYEYLSINTASREL